MRRFLFAETQTISHFGLLLLRLGIGAIMFKIGLPKIMGGVEMWTQVGSAMQIIGIDFAPAFWGFLASFAESGGALLLAFGLLFRPAALMLAFTMLMAMLTHMNMGDDFSGWSRAAELGIVFLALAITGPGKYSIDNRLN